MPTDPHARLPELDWSRTSQDVATAAHGGLTFSLHRHVLIPRRALQSCPARTLFELSVDRWFDGAPRFLAAREDIRAVMDVARYWADRLPQPVREVAA